MKKLDTHFFKPFIEGALNTLKIQCGVDAKPGKPFIKGTGREIITDIAGVIGLASSAVAGTIALCFPKDVFLRVMSRMIGQEQNEITSELQDGVSELLNMIFGHAKRVLNAEGYDIQMALPTVFCGQGLEFKHLTSAAIFVLPFTTEFGEFHIEICAEASQSKG